MQAYLAEQKCSTNWKTHIKSNQVKLKQIRLLINVGYFLREKENIHCSTGTKAEYGKVFTISNSQVRLYVEMNPASHSGRQVLSTLHQTLFKCPF